MRYDILLLYVRVVQRNVHVLRTYRFLLELSQAEKLFANNRGYGIIDNKVAITIHAVLCSK